MVAARNNHETELRKVNPCHSLHISFLSPASGPRVNPRRSIFRCRSRWFLSASDGSSAAGGGGEPWDRRAVYISFAYHLGVGRLEAFLPLAMVVPGTIYLILFSGVGVGRFTELGDFVEVTFCFFIGVLLGDSIVVLMVLVADCADEELVLARK
jgi:hypothetical protein